MIDVIRFSVVGRPITQGSKVGFYRGGRAVLVEAQNLKRKTLPRDLLKNWRAMVQGEAMLAVLRDTDEWELWLGPVELTCDFVFERPPSHHLKSGKVRPSSLANIPPGDLSKLTRAVEDSLSKVVYKDDTQITQYGAGYGKRWGEVAGVGVEVRRL